MSSFQKLVFLFLNIMPVVLECINLLSVATQRQVTVGFPNTARLIINCSIRTLWQTHKNAVVCPPSIFFSCHPFPDCLTHFLYRPVHHYIPFSDMLVSVSSGCLLYNLWPLSPQISWRHWWWYGKDSMCMRYNIVLFFLNLAAAFQLLMTKLNNYPSIGNLINLVN